MRGTTPLSLYDRARGTFENVCLESSLRIQVLSHLATRQTTQATKPATLLDLLRIVEDHLKQTHYYLRTDAVPRKLRQYINGDGEPA